MDQEPQQPQDEPPAAGGRSGIFQNLNTTIAGVTGLAIALGGLAAAWDRIFASDEPVAEVAADTSAGQPAAGQPAEAEAAPAADDPLLYEADGIRLEWTGDQWQLTDGDSVSHYEDVYSPDETRVLAYDRASDSYLRWPVNGGMAETGSADKQSWDNYAELYPPEA